MRWSINAWISLLVCACAFAGPVDFGLDEYNAAVAERHLKWKVKYELTADPPETYRIEPYAVGGAHVTGGDLRGLMYGLLEAADQIRATGRMKQVHAEPATPVRGVRMFARAAALEESDSFWRSYFQTLARDRFNRFTLVFTALPANPEKLRAITQIAADYAIDFTLAIWEHSPSDTLKKFLSACPSIRSVAIRSDSTDAEAIRGAVFKPLRDAGHRIALDPMGTLAHPDFIKAAERAGVALRFAPSSWPPSFDLDLPPEFENHQELYWLWGHTAYDPKIKPPHSENPDEFHAAARITTLIAAAQAADPRMFTIPDAIRSAPETYAEDNDWMASISEAVRDRVERVSSAKVTPPEVADELLTSAAALDKSGVPDFQLLANLARFHAHDERASYEIELFDRTKDAAALDRADHEIEAARALFNFSDPRLAERHRASDILSGATIPPMPKRLPRPQIVHTPVRSAAAGQPISVSLRFGSLKDLTTVRLHYRAADSATLTSVVEKPAAASMTFEIPGASSDLIYYFEILNHANSGWFEPDPEQVKPYHLIRIEQK